MSTLTCHFCAHINPEVAKFCSDCGSPLHLKPCPQCEAINDVTAETCYQCGAPFDAASVTVARVEATEATATEALTQRAEASVADAVAQPTAASFAAAFAEPVAASVTDAFAKPVAATVTDASAEPGASSVAEASAEPAASSVADAFAEPAAASTAGPYGQLGAARTTGSDTIERAVSAPSSHVSESPADRLDEGSAQRRRAVASRSGDLYRTAAVVIALGVLGTVAYNLYNANSTGTPGRNAVIGEEQSRATPAAAPPAAEAKR